MLLAHIGHWSLWILYAVPVIAVLASIVSGMVRERRKSAAGSVPEPPERE